MAWGYFGKWVAFIILFGGSLVVKWVLPRSRSAQKPPQKPTADTQDCFFDPECHGKVDWKIVGELKEAFFAELKSLKEKGDPKEVKGSMMRMHRGFLNAGMPENRIDYILSKWIQFGYPEAFDVADMWPTITISGLQCGNGYGKDLNQDYAFQGYTKDGRPYYRGVSDSRSDRYLYYDHHCSSDTPKPRWLLGGKPNINLDQGLNEHDGEGCDNDFSIMTDSHHLPAGPQRVAWQWCGDHGNSDSSYVSITYALPKEPDFDQCSKYAKFGDRWVKGCKSCETYYGPKRTDECLGCGKKCSKYCPDHDWKCYTTGKEFLECSKKCMSSQDTDVCSKYEGYGDMAIKGCKSCEKYYGPKRTDECMGCGKKCSKYCPDHDWKCYTTGKEFLDCSKKCLSQEKPVDEKETVVV
eukprot:TRINITY_DN2515_c0_g1_i2.p1 TRINITY_DN2515_c0_g1~~TRINITY_DN2515_c0_g1_i2.p1  ORF type:complete len:409 (+),score=61.34 TRINITY_DN2515_c0_g1_i2:75-1301(+)